MLSQNRINEYALAFYDALNDAAELEQLENEGSKVLIFRGSLTKVYDSLSISMSYYSPIKKLLSDTGAVQVLRAGNKMQDSCVLLLERPSPEAMLEHGVQPLTTAADRATLERRIEALEQRLGEVPIQNTVINFEERLRKLEAGASGLKSTAKGRK